MPEVSKMGREPIAKVTIHQDKCNKTWGVGACSAGKTNFIPNSSDLNDSSWDSSSYSFVGGYADPWGGTTAQRATYSFVINSIINSNDVIPGSAFGDLWVSAAFKTVAGIDSVSILTGISGGWCDAKVNLNTGALINGLNYTKYLNATVTDLGGGWYSFQGRVPADYGFNQLFRFSFGDDSSGLPNNGDIVDIAGLMITTNKDQEYMETSGVSVVATSTKPCFNTRSTCQDSTNYEVETLPLKFIKSRSPAPDDDYYLPCLTSVSVGPASLNPGGANKSSSPFGTRATISATFKDFPHNDKLVDPYADERDYNPLERGTFWTKWAARNPYYLHRIMTLESGYLLNGQIVDSTVRTFVITSFDGVDSGGNVKVSGKDILTLAENSKAQAPRASSGVLSADISAAATTLTASPAGVGDIEYPASGYIRIEKEILSFTRAGDVFTVVRGRRATTAEYHSEDATIQLCLEYDSQLPVDILEDLFTNYAGIPSAFLDTANWSVEGGSYLPRLYTTLITEPTGVSDLVGEMCEQMFFSVWWDERTSLVKLRAVRAPQDDVIYDLDDYRNIIKDSVSWGDLPDQLVTEVNVYYGQINPTEKLDDTSNYSTVETYLNTSASSASKHGINKIKTIYSRWIPATATATANDLALKIANRFGEIPKQITFHVDAKDSFLWLGDFVRLQNRLLVDIYGSVRNSNMQIFSASEIELGSKFSYTANEFFLTEPEDPNALEVIIGSNLLNVNLRSLFDDQFGLTLDGSETINFRIRSGVVIGGDTCGGGVNVSEAARNTANDFYLGGNWRDSSNEIGLLPVLQKNDISVVTTTNSGDIYRLHSGELGARAEWIIKEYPVSVALETGTFPTGTTVNLILEDGAMILGEGGNGLAHSLYSPFNYFIPAGDGGDALKIDFDINIYNNGIIAGGGGGGSAHEMYRTSSAIFVVTGGGGAGSLQSRVRNELRIGNTYTFTASEAGSYESGGSGGTGKIGGTEVNYTGTAKGSGGNLAEAGQAITYTSGSTGEYGVGGQAGKAIRAGTNLITWSLKGDVRGVESV